MKHQDKIRQRAEQITEKANTKARTRLYPKPGQIFVFNRRGEMTDVRPAVAPFLKSNPIVNGVRMRYRHGALVPRVKR